MQTDIVLAERDGCDVAKIAMLYAMLAEENPELSLQYASESLVTASEGYVTPEGTRVEGPTSVPRAYYDAVHPIIYNDIALAEVELLDMLSTTAWCLEQDNAFMFDRQNAVSNRARMAEVWRKLLPYVPSKIQEWITNECYLNDMLNCKTYEDIRIIFDKVWDLSNDARLRACQYPNFMWVE